MRVTGREHAPYRTVLREREFRALWASYGLSLLGDQLARIAVSLLVLERSRSPTAAAAVFACSFLPALLGGPVLAALADRHPRRSVMLACDLVRTVLMLALVLPDLPLPLVFAVLLLVGLLEPPFDSARMALLPDVLPEQAYANGNALLHLTMQVGQIAGYLTGGVLVAAFGSRAALGADAATFLLSAGAVLLAVRVRPAPLQPEQRTGLLSETAAGARYVAGSPVLRRLLTVALLGAAVAIVPEGLAVPVAAELHAGSAAAGLLLASLPAGFLVGGWLLTLVGRDRRPALLVPLLVGTCLPLLLTPLSSSVTLTCALWGLAGAGSALQVIANPAYVQAVPSAMRARALGLAGSVLAAGQGLALLAGTGLTSWVGPRPAVAVVATVVLAALLVAARPGLLGRGTAAQKALPVAKVGHG